LPPPPPPLSLSDEAAEPAREHESLLAVLALPYVKPFCLAYGLLKPIRFTLQFWLPYYLQKELQYSHSLVTSLVLLYDLGAFGGGVLYGSLLDRLFLGQLFVPLSLLLAASLFSLSAIAALGPFAHSIVIVLLGSTIAGLDNIGSGATSGTVNEMVGGSTQRTLPYIVSALSGLSSLSSSLYLIVLPHIAQAGWQTVFRLNGVMALAAAGFLLFTCRRVAPAESEGRSSQASPMLKKTKVD